MPKSIGYYIDIDAGADQEISYISARWPGPCLLIGQASIQAAINQSVRNAIVSRIMIIAIINSDVYVFLFYRYPMET